MPPVRPECPTAKDALIGAILTAAGSLSTNPDEELHEATFGRYADLNAGWHWGLETRRRYVSERPARIREADHLERRIRMIISAWEAAVERYTEPGGDAA